ncbi:hypothetical protein [Azospirillum brasilense]|uniref:hypothetical protein n=1 Tax=Azospirillum brasilense TaxID=192 RepID=UPI001178BDF7|nr:hypothetical protein [Azospirillum brasilense]
MPHNFDDDLYGVQQAWHAQIDLYIIMAAIVSAILIGVSVHFSRKNNIGDNKLKAGELIGIITVVAGLFTGYYQWRMSRYEASLERLYERIDVSNRRLADVINYANQDKNPYEHPRLAGLSVFDMWVFAELDNLEYVLEKYQFGWIKYHHVYRSLVTLKARCAADQTFCRRAIESCGISGYQSSTCSVVARIVKAAEDDARNSR